jgi:hypothetical protein
LSNRLVEAVLVAVAHGNDATCVGFGADQREALAVDADSEEGLAGAEEDWVDVEVILVDEVCPLQRLDDAGAALNVDRLSRFPLEFADLVLQPVAENARVAPVLGRQRCAPGRCSIAWFRCSYQSRSLS